MYCNLPSTRETANFNPCLARCLQFPRTPGTSSGSTFPAVLIARSSITTNHPSPQNSSGDAAVRAIALALVRVGQYDRAVQLSQNITDPYGLYEIVVAFTDAGEFERALDVAQTIADENANARALGDLALALTEVGEFERALQIAQLFANEQQRLVMVRQITVALVKAGKVERALQVAQTFNDKISTVYT